MQCAYALLLFPRVFSIKPCAGSIPAQQPVSIIICARNEGANLAANLLVVLSQTYGDEQGRPMYEVIVVDDASADETGDVLRALCAVHPHLRVVTIAKEEARNMPGKKFALGRGVACAAHEWLLLTDADCVPASPQWLRDMTAPLQHGKQIVAGYGGYRARPGLLNRFIRWETLHAFLQYSAYAMAGMPYMAVGRNMACTRGALLRAQQSPVWGMLPSGDDDLLVSLEGTRDNMAIVCTPAAFTYTEAKHTWREWMAQKQRHLSAGKYYRWLPKVLLGLYGVAHASMWLYFTALLFTPHWQAAVALMAVRCATCWLLWAGTAAKLREKKLIYFLPFADVAWMVYNFAFLPYITWKNKKQWT